MLSLRTISLALACVALGSSGCSSSDPADPPVAQQPGVDAAADAVADASADASADVPVEAAEAGPDVAEEAAPEASQPDADKAANCAQDSDFGSELTMAYGRIDGTVRALVGTEDTQCAVPNSDHLVIQVLMNGKTYRMVASVLSTYGDPDVGLLEKDAPLAGSAWSEGWHTDLSLDYVTTLGVHTTDFTGHPMLELQALVESKIEIGSKISVYATNNNAQYKDSAHLIHRNITNQDGAIVIGPDTANPHYLLFRFANQSF
jgi:hypothetical protein